MSDQQNDNPASATDLTAEELLIHLVAGKKIVLANGDISELPNEKQRHLLQFFLDHEEGKKLYQNPFTRGNDNLANAILDWMHLPFNSPQIQRRPGAKTAPPRWAVRQVEIVQFGGLHPFCLPDGSTPRSLVLDVDRDIAAFQGVNGAGKSSIAKAITFALTGKVPQTAGEPVAFETLLNDYTIPGQDSVRLPTVAPMPTAEQWKARNKSGCLTVETAVTVTFVDSKNTQVAVRRTVETSGSGSRAKFASKVTVNGNVADSVENALGISSLAMELSVLHMARLPLIALGKPESLGDGVRALTGLRSIGTLAEVTVDKFANYLSTTYVKNKSGDLTTAAETFSKKADELAACFCDSPTQPPEALAPSEGDACKARLDDIGKELDNRSAVVRAEVAKAAGVKPDTVVLDGLDESLIKIQTTLTLDALRADPLAGLVNELATLDQTIVDDTRRQLAELAARANTFAKAHADKQTFVLRRLYALVGQWLKDQGNEGEPKNCPVCRRPLTDGEQDEELHLPIARAIADAQRDEAQLRFSLDEFVANAVDEFKERLPDAVSKVLKSLKLLDRESLPAGWAASVSTGARTLLNPVLALSAVAGGAKAALAGAAAKLPPMSLSPIPHIHADLTGTRVDIAVRTVTDLLDAAEWAHATVADRANAIRAAYGAGDSAESLPDTSLLGVVATLRQLLANNKPVSSARGFLAELRTQRQAWSDANDRIAQATEIAGELKKLGDLKRMVDVQVGGLLDTLNTRTAKFLDDFHRPSTAAGPQQSRLDHDGKAITAQAELGDVRGNAAHVTNSSRQRAQLFSFVLALTEHIWHRSGGLRLVLLDDPQTLFDEDNQIRLAKGLVARAADGFMPLIVTFDKVFAERLGRAGKMTFGSPVSAKVSRWEIVPRPDNESPCAVKPHRNPLITERDNWRALKSDHSRIDRYCSEARKFIERTLVKLLNESNAPVTNFPTLEPLAGQLRRLMANPNSSQSSLPFKNLLALLPDGIQGKEALGEALNWSHHFQGEDLRQHHAEAVDSLVEDFLDLSDRCFDILFFGAPAAPAPVVIPFPTPAVPKTAISDIGRVAASSSDVSPAFADDAPSGAISLDPDLHAAFAVGQVADWLPHPIDRNTVLIVESTILSGSREGDWVLARDSTTGEMRAGRVGKVKDGTPVVVSGVNGHSKIYAFEQMELRRIVGGLFERAVETVRPFTPFDIVLAHFDSCHAIEVSAGDSAEPLLRRGDYALVGSTHRPDELSLGTAGYAFRLSDGQQVLKRLSHGQRLDGYRQLLPLGGQGDGVIVSDSGATSSIAPSIVEARPLIGFWRK